MIGSRFWEYISADVAVAAVVANHLLALLGDVGAHGREPFQAVEGSVAFSVPGVDFLMFEPVRGAVIDGGGVLVNVPHPARFALHKRMVSRERDVTAQSKVAKDLAQAAQLLEVLMDERPGDLSRAWEEVERRGRGWVKRVRRALMGSAGEQKDVFEKAAGFLDL